MSKKIESLKRSAERDEQRIQKLQESVKVRKEKIRELENEEILSNLNSLHTGGVPVREIVAAIRDRDAETLIRLVEGGGPSAEQSGTGSASQITKGDEYHE